MIADIEGNLYKIVTIGTQVWMAENLRTTKYNDNTSIPLVADNTVWGNLITPGYCWYNNDEATNKPLYGALYNWNTVNTGKLCPAGWHVPTDDQWTTLTTYLGGENIAGGKLKEIGNIHWTNGNVGATNETGFTALPGGDRDYNGLFTRIGITGIWQSSTPYVGKAMYLIMYGNQAAVSHSSSAKVNGYSVRCLKDN